MTLFHDKYQFLTNFLGVLRQLFNFALAMEKEYPVIVIGRSFGAGGKAIGKALSSILGYPFFDKELLREAAEEFGFSKEIFARADEKRPSRLKRLVTHLYGVQENYIADTLSTESLYKAQSSAIRAIAERGPCIIVGRTADYILRDFQGLVSIFVHAPLAFRAMKIVERGDAPDEVEAIELARQKDRNRMEYYNYFTGRNWGLASNYNLTVDSSLLSAEKCAELIADFIAELRR